MVKCRWNCFDSRAAVFALGLMVLIAGLSDEGQGQIKPSMKIKLNVLPSVTISEIAAGAQSQFKGELAHLNGLTSRQIGKTDSVKAGPGFTITAFENISVLLSYTTPSRPAKGNNRTGAVRVLCGYLNDGTTYFRRATITDKSPIQIRLRNNRLLKHSMLFSDPQFVAYVFFLISQRKEARKNESPLSVSTVTVEFM